MVGLCVLLAYLSGRPKHGALRHICPIFRHTLGILSLAPETLACKARASLLRVESLALSIEH